MPSPVKPSLVNSSPAQQTSPTHNLSLNTSIPSDGPSPSWPDRPSVSPITPTSEEPHPQPQPNATAAISDSHNHPPPIELPNLNLNLNLTENPDAIALSTAISILQIQRQQTITDIQTLNQLKTAALHDPQGFLTDLKDKKLARSSHPGLDLDVGVAVADQDQPENQDPTSPPRKSAFPPIPPTQSIIRTPPINWEKYHIVGSSLDKLHTQQQRYPGITDTQIQQSGHPPKHEIAAPYRPGIDRLEDKGSR
jgi:hypothetical protein